jgi:hypothetical protein
MLAQKLRVYIAGALLALTTRLQSHATMLIVVYTPDGYWIGADSARSFNEKRFETVCKVHDTKFGLLLKAGNAQGTTTAGVLYSTDKVVEDLLATTTSAEEFRTNLRLKFTQDIEAEIVYLDDDPKLTLQKLHSVLLVNPIPTPWIFTLTRAVSLFDPDAQDPLGEVLFVRPESAPLLNPLTGTALYRYSAQSFGGWHRIDDPSFQRVHAETNAPVPCPKSVRMLADPVAYTKDDAWVQSHPKAALLEMLRLGHSQKPEDIGEPYVIVHVIQRKGQKRKVRWIEKGACPAWSEDVNPDAALRNLIGP